ncbi:DeoR/GlpR family DNA-binding transcription regulator [Gorillibacterium massiliense]|uniref:DeoR/GlpR family DNA-binding transcription regulator n=1 Tax=Gorillibacterium massiliense TaxID=1280390 RepID=UPI0004BC29FD|nr:DeoR/GlpR family DNA-binding transcription regulator [Gorillibacterium massiliense]
MFAEERLLRIVEMVKRSGKATVAELSEALSVSPVTIRRDLERLEEEQLLYRTHGGAISPERSFRETAHERSFAEKEDAFIEEKERIAEEAARLVNDGDAVLMTPGTTNMVLARHLIGKKELTVVTNAVNIAAALGGQTGWNVMLTGGRLRPQSFALVGPLAERSLSDMRVDKLFIGVDGIDLREGITTPNMEEAGVNRQMINIAKEVIIVADRSKFGKVAFSRIAGLDTVHTIVTDSKLPEVDAEQIRKDTDIKLILA